MESLDDRLISIDCKKMEGKDPTIEEQELLQAWESSHPGDEEYLVTIADLQDVEEFENGKETAWSKISQQCFPPQEEEKQEEEIEVIRPGRMRYLWNRFTILPRLGQVAVVMGLIIKVAAFVCVVMFIIMLLQTDKPSVSPTTPVAKVPLDDVAPGKDKATLTLTDGVTLTIDPATKSAVLQVPEGRQFTFFLADSTKVQVNAASKLRYPLAFDGRERTVELSGEAYFEVTKDKEKPFIVFRNQDKVLVHGTHFNVKAYKGDSTAVTLLEGSVEVFTPKLNALLHPHEQFMSGKGVHALSGVEVEDVSGWTQGVFKYHNTDIRIMMSEIARWYDKRVMYRNIDKKMVLEMGGISRSLPLEEVLSMLRQTGAVDFVLRGDTIEVYIPLTK